MRAQFQLMGILLLSSVPAFAQESRHFIIQPENSTFTIKVGRGGFLKVFGHDHVVEVRRFGGEVNWRPEAPESSDVLVDIESASLTVADPDVKVRERAEIQSEMESKVLEVERYPEIRFMSTRLELDEGRKGELVGRVKGELTLHGVTLDIEIPVRLVVSETELRAWGRFKLKGSRFGIRQIRAAGGTVKTKDELELSFDLVGERR
ncbi:MAG: YceI family protein [Acidobacteriota bacterium]